MNKGLIFDIQRFSINDGPGIRTTVFFKGCSLRCSWCHNPESISSKRQLNYDSNKCKLCLKCVSDSIYLKENKLFIDFNVNDQNFSLVDVCPNSAYSICGDFYTVEDVLNIVLRDKDYYFYSNGGVSISGGDAINQFNFSLNLLKELKKNNIHTVFDASGFNPHNHLFDLIDYTDIFLLDFKSSDEDVLKTHVKKVFSIIPILDVFEKKDVHVILRCPIILGVNDSKNHFQEISELYKKYQCIKEVNVLGYHNLIKNIEFKRINDFSKFEMVSDDLKDSWILMLKQLGCENIK